MTTTYVNINGNPLADGSKTNPIDPITAMSVPTGDIVHYQPGLYQGLFNLNIDGDSPANPTIHEGEAGVIFDCGETNNRVDSFLLSIRASNIILRGFTFQQHCDFSSLGDPAPAAIYVLSGENITISDCVFRDCGQGVQSFANGKNLSIEDSIFYNNGASYRDHAVYMHNPTNGWKRISRCLFFNNYDYPVHLWGSQDVHDMFVMENIFFNNQAAHVCCGGSLMHNLMFYKNATYYPKGSNMTNMFLGQGSFGNDRHDRLDLHFNYFAGGGCGGGALIDCSYWQNVFSAANTIVAYEDGYHEVMTFIGAKQAPTNRFIKNTYYLGNDARFNCGLDSSGRSLDWKKDMWFDSDSFYLKGRSTANKYILIDNPLLNRIYIVVYNWFLSIYPVIPIDLPWFKSGDSYNLSVAWDKDNILLSNHVFDGEIIILPDMTTLPSLQKSYRNLPTICNQATNPEFAVFILQKL